MTQEQWDSICKPKSEWRDFKEHPLTPEEVDRACQPIKDAIKRLEEQKRWTPEKDAQLRRPMDI